MEAKVSQPLVFGKPGPPGGGPWVQTWVDPGHESGPAKSGLKYLKSSIKGKCKRHSKEKDSGYLFACLQKMLISSEGVFPSGHNNSRDVAHVMGSEWMNCFPEQSQQEQDLPSTLSTGSGEDEQIHTKGVCRCIKADISAQGSQSTQSDLTSHIISCYVTGCRIQPIKPDDTHNNNTTGPPENGRISPLWHCDQLNEIQQGKQFFFFFFFAT